MGRLVGLLRDRMKMLLEDAAAVGAVVEEAFAGESELDDERLDKDLRQVFYSLQDEKILDVRRVERTDPAGQSRRHYLWTVREEAQLPVDVARPQPSEEEQLYLRLRDTSWERRPLEPDVA